MAEHDQRDANDTPLWQLSLDDAMRVRWQQGREKYGEAWQGRHPLVEGFEELIDAQIYLALAQAPCAVRLALQALTERVALLIRELSPGAHERWTGANLAQWRPRP